MFGLCDYSPRGSSAVHNMNGQVKVILTVAFVLLVVTTPAGALWAFAAYAVCLSAVLTAARLPLTYVATRLAMVVPFVLAIAAFIPFLPDHPGAGGYSLSDTAGLSRWMIFGTIMLKAGLGAAAAIVLTATTPFSQLLHALARLRVPRLLVLMLSFAYRYLFVLVDEAHRMKRACDSRCYQGRWLGHVQVFGYLIGTLFLRSYERGERVYLAMLARGFDGQFPAHDVGRLRKREILAGMTAALTLISIRLFTV